MKRCMMMWPSAARKLWLNYAGAIDYLFQGLLHPLMRLARRMCKGLHMLLTQYICGRELNSYTSNRQPDYFTRIRHIASIYAHQILQEGKLPARDLQRNLPR